MTPGDTAESTPDPPSDSSQYQDDNSQYPIFRTIFREDAPWNWTWTLAVCDSDVLSTSDETGSNVSHDWTWNWIWNWTCDETPANSAEPAASTPDGEDHGSGVPQSGPGNVNVSIRVLSPGDDGAVTQTNTTPTPAPGRSGDPSWVWAWTFAWCGTTTEISTLAGEGTGLDWDWNWTWLWDCAPTVEAPPTPDNPPPGGGGNSGGPPAETPAPHGEAPSSPPVHDGSGVPSPFTVPSVAVPESVAEWVLRVSWVTPGTSGTAFPTWLSAPVASPLDTTPWVPVQWPALPARAGRRSPDRRDRRWASRSASRSRASCRPRSRSLRCRSCHHSSSRRQSTRSRSRPHSRARPRSARTDA